jgi:hypothetical protein
MEDPYGSGYPQVVHLFGLRVGQLFGYRFGYRFGQLFGYRFGQLFGYRFFLMYMYPFYCNLDRRQFRKIISEIKVLNTLVAVVINYKMM